MVGIFNSVGHETEFDTKEAASALFGALASVYEALALVEVGNAADANAELELAGARLREVFPRFEQLYAAGTDTPLLSATGPTTSPAELSELQERLHRHGYSISLRNRDLFGIAAAEVRLLAATLEHVDFRGLHADWYGVRDVIHQVNRLTDLGVTVSRLASLTGGDPGLQG